MLKGKINYNGNMIEIKGYDLRSYFAVKFSDPLNTGILGEDVYSVDCLLSPTNVKYLGIKCKLAELPYNNDLITWVASVIFAMKSECGRDNLKGFYDIDFKEDALGLQEYEIPDMGTVSIRLGAIEELNYKDLVILKEVDGFYEKPFADLETTVRYKNELIYRNTSTFDNDLGFFAGQMLTMEEIIRMHPEKNFDYVLNANLKVLSKEDIPEFVQMLKSIDGPIAFDTETTGLRITFKEEDKLVGMSFSPNETEGYYVPLRHKAFDNVCEEWEIRDFLRDTFGDILENGKIILQNAPFDWKVMYSEGINMNTWFDVYGAFHLTIWNEARMDSLSLKSLAKRFLGHDSLELSDLVYGGWSEESGITFDMLSRGIVKYYACMDSLNTYQLYKYILEQNLLEYYNASKVFKLECQFAKAIGYQEYYGHRVDIERVPELKKDLEAEVSRLSNEIYKLAGHEFNVASTKELRTVLFDELQLPIISRTRTGEPSTARSVLDALSPTHEMPRLLGELRDASKLLSDFSKSFAKLATGDGFMFSGVNQYLETGRVSVKDPNYQSYSPSVKKRIVPRKGYYYFDFDFSAVEYRIMACMAHEDVLIEQFKDYDTDIHSYQASRMFGVPLMAVSKSLRSQSKGVSFGLMYGMGDKHLGASIFGKVSDENTKKAANLMRLFFTGQEKTKAFFDRAQKSSYELGYSETFLGRRRYFDKNKYPMHKIQRMGANHVIQGTAADFFKHSVNNLMAMIKENGWEGLVLIPFFVHDEAVLEVHESIDPMILMKEVMRCTRIQIKNWCPLINECGYGHNWYEAKSAEISAGLQDILIGKYGNSGVDWWDGNIDNLVNHQEAYKNAYMVNRIKKYLTDPENKGRHIYAPILKFGQSLLGNILGGNIVGLSVVGDVNAYSFDKDDPIKNFKSAIELLGLEGIYESANVIEEMEKGEEKQDESTEIDDTPLKVSVLDKVMSFYFSLDIENKILWVRLPNNSWVSEKLQYLLLENIGSISDRNLQEDGFKLLMMDENGDKYDTGKVISQKGLLEISKYINTVKRMVQNA